MVNGAQLFKQMDKEIDGVFERHILSRNTDEGPDRLLAAIQVFAARLGQLTGMYLTFVHHLPEEQMDEQLDQLVARLKEVVTDDIAIWAKRITEAN